MMKLLRLFTAFSLVTAIVSCQKSDEITVNPVRPEFGTLELTDVTADGVSVNTAFTYEGTAEITSVGFAYKTNDQTEYNYVVCDQWDGFKPSYVITGLESETQYRIYCYVTIDGERNNSLSRTFTTLKSGDVPPPVTTKPEFGTPSSSGITQTDAMLSCTMTYGGDDPLEEVGFEYKVSSASSYTTVTVTASAGTKTTALSGLTKATAYTFRLYATVGGKKYTSADATFTTESGTVVPPDPSGGARYTGWAELPVEKVQSGENYFAYHLCPDVNVPGTSQKRRNFGVCYSNSLKCAIWVAAPMHDCYAVKNTNRTDAYKADPTIPISQPGSWSGYTRGHMLGSAERLVSNQTNRQVFYHSNIAPQLQTCFNTGGGAWNTLEDWVDTQWQGKADTTYQIIGSYWENKNKVVNGTTIPTHYYKVLLRTKGHKNKWVVNCSRDELQCIAIMVKHKTYSKAEVPEPNEYVSKGMVYTVKQMEEMTGLTFFPNVPNAPKDSYNRSDWGL